MKTVVAEFASPREEPNELSKLVIKQLAEMDIDVILLELDDNDDNLFLSIRDNGELYHNPYLRIRLDNEYYRDTAVYFVDLMLRQHSGGDIAHGSVDCELEILPTEINQYIHPICQIYIEYTKKGTL
ncbi:hypothetical protein [Vibrio genomosp. F10]|nr:hypothetical protein [Vibrio genomosp. F10]